MPGEFSFPRFRSGEQVVEPRRWNDPHELLEAIGNLQVGEGLEIIKDASGWFISLSDQATANRLVLTPSGGIPAASYASGVLTAGSALCTPFRPDPAHPDRWILGSGDGEKVRVRNTQVGTGNDVAGNMVCQTKSIDDRLCLDVEPCPVDA
jgi:hypothetical protein